MKTIFKILLLSLISFEGVSQNDSATSLTISKIKLTKMQALEEIIPSLPKDCKIVFYEFATMVAGKVIHRSGNGDKFLEKAKEILKNAKTGSRAYLDLRFNYDSKSFNKTYSFKVKG